MERVLIVEDEALAADKLKMLLARINPQLQPVATLATVAETVAWLSSNTADLIFLDINLADDICFKIFDQVVVETPIVFTTAYDAYAIRAFRQNSLDYILKPVTEEGLRASMLKYEKQQARVWQAHPQIQNLINLYNNPTPAYKSRLLVSYGGKSKSIGVDEVAYAYAFEKGVYITLQSGQTYLIDDTLDTLEASLDPQRFFRVNRKYLVAFSAIVEIIKYSTRRLKLHLQPAPKFDAIVPAEKITKLKDWLNS